MKIKSHASIALKDADGSSIVGMSCPGGSAWPFPNLRNHGDAHGSSIGYSGRLRRAPNVLYMIQKYTKKVVTIRESGIQFTEIECLPCVSFLALFLLLDITVLFCDTN